MTIKEINVSTSIQFKDQIIKIDLNASLSKEDDLKEVSEKLYLKNIELITNILEKIV